MFSPTWKEYEKDMSSQDPKKAVKATEAFEAERDFQLKNDKKAKAWEDGRKADLAKQKPDFVKKRLQKEKEEQEKPIKNLLKAGTYETFHPTSGHVLIELDTYEQEIGGFIIPVTQEEPNTGTVLDVGAPLRCKHCFAEARHQSVKDVTIDLEAKVGEHVMFKRLAGLEVFVSGKKCRMMAFSDVLAIV